jgi:hypothetical protein
VNNNHGPKNQPSLSFSPLSSVLLQSMGKPKQRAILGQVMRELCVKTARSKISIQWKVSYDSFSKFFLSNHKGSAESKELEPFFLI